MIEEENTLNGSDEEAAQTSETPETPKIIRAAKINAAGVFVGVVEVLESELTDRHFPEFGDCDLPPNKYRWDEKAGAFVPLPKNATEEVIQEPHALRALVAGFIAVKESGIELPKETLDYIAWYQQTFDFKG